MVICHIITGFSFGGAERLLVNFANIHARQHKVHIVFLKGEATLKPLLDSSIKLHHFTLGLGSVLQLRNLIKEIGAQVVHTHLGHADFLGFLACAGLKCKLFCTMHNIWFKFNYKDYLIFAAYWLSFKTIAKRASVICISKVVEKHVNKVLGVANSRSHLVYNCIPSLEKNISKEEARAQLEVRKEAFCALFVGRLEKQKSLHTLIEAVSLLPKKMLDNTIVLIVGEGSLEKDLKQHTQALGVSSHIRFEGATFNPEKYFLAADVFLLSSVFEGLGIVILEAFRAGLPVIASAIEGPEELILHKENGLLFEMGNAHAMCEQIKLLYNDKDFRIKIAEKAQQGFQDRFEIKTYAKRLIEIYTE